MDNLLRSVPSEYSVPRNNVINAAKITGLYINCEKNGKSMYLILDALLNWLTNSRSPDINAAVSSTNEKNLLLQSREKLADNNFLIAANSLNIFPAEQHTARKQCHSSKYNT